MLFCCAQFDFTIFDNTTKPRPAKGKRSKKYPAIKPSYESTSIPRLYFGKLNRLHITDCLFNPPRMDPVEEISTPPPPFLIFWRNMPPGPPISPPSQCSGTCRIQLPSSSSFTILCEYFHSDLVTRIKKIVHP